MCLCVSIAAAESVAAVAPPRLAVGAPRVRGIRAAAATGEPQAAELAHTSGEP